MISARDAFATGYHAWLLQRKYPHAEIAFSCPRLRPIINNDRINPMDVHEAQLLQVVCAYRPADAICKYHYLYQRMCPRKG